MGEALGYPMQMIDLLDLNLAVAAVVVIAVGVLAAGGDFASRNGGWWFNFCVFCLVLRFFFYVYALHFGKVVISEFLCFSSLHFLVMLFCDVNGAFVSIYYGQCEC